MSIRLKIILVVLPLIISTLVLTSVFSSSSAESGLTQVAIDFSFFKMEQMQQYSESQWNLMVTNGLSEDEEFLIITQNDLEAKARELTKTPNDPEALEGITEWIFALDAQGQLAMSSLPGASWSEEDATAMADYLAPESQGWIEYTLQGKDRVAQNFYFAPFDWRVFVSEERSAFFAGVTEIQFTNMVILVISVIFGVIILVVFTAYLTQPIKKMVVTMEDIIRSNDLSQKVDVEYQDEIGTMAHTFNVMLEELGGAYAQIKNFALQSVLAKKSEQKIRNIFQKYVPENVINEIFAHPETMLVGSNRRLAILFSDIRSFTTISETLPPDELVKSLNRYFDVMVDIIIQRKGIVDKYIGDAIMAFFGAPVRSENDALLSVLAGLGMVKALDDFNADQIERGAVEFKIGVGINFGEVTVGNIGTDKKMDYTVIGDGVNLASRLEGLTKEYKQTLIFSDSVYQNVAPYIPCRLVDKVQVKGKTEGANIYTATLELSESQRHGWALYHSALEEFFQQNFDKAITFLQEALKIIDEDYLCELYLMRSHEYKNNPPGPGWDGTTKMTHK
jgi:adenylate cyclase